MRKHDSKLRTLRRARTLSQAQLAMIVGISQQTISKAERGIDEISKEKKELIATILGSSRAELFPEDERVPA